VCVDSLVLSKHELGKVPWEDRPLALLSAWLLMVATPTPIHSPKSQCIPHSNLDFPLLKISNFDFILTRPLSGNHGLEGPIILLSEKLPIFVRKI
jgi:hypothetical protein